MTAIPEKRCEQVELVLASSDQKPVLVNLLQLYAHDFSEFHPIEFGADGRYEYKHLELYWREPYHYPFLIQVDSQVAGLVFVKRASEHQRVWDMAEFFVLRSYRRQGIGMIAAHEVWAKFPGPWEVRVMQSNRCALAFWTRAITTFRGEAASPTCIEKDGVCWYVFAFEC